MEGADSVKIKSDVDVDAVKKFWQENEEKAAAGLALDGERGRILLDAFKVINGERQDQYGNPENNFKTIALLWTTYLGASEGYITEYDVALMMGLLKIARLSTGTATRDSFIDACGYLALAADISTNNK